MSTNNREFPTIEELSNGFSEFRLQQCDKMTALEGIYSTVVLRNILQRNSVAEEPNDKIYIQVTESMQVPETRERELRPLRIIPDNYEKIVLSMDRNFINSYDGVKVLNLIDWLLG